MSIAITEMALFLLKLLAIFLFAVYTHWVFKTLKKQEDGSVVWRDNALKLLSFGAVGVFLMVVLGSESSYRPKVSSSASVQFQQVQPSGEVPTSEADKRDASFVPKHVDGEAVLKAFKK